MSGRAPETEVSALLARSGMPVDGMRLQPCAASGNNRVFVAHAGAIPVVAKLYFASTEDSRDRLRAEWDFLSVAAEADIPWVPRPIAYDETARLALYEYIDGVPIGPGDIGDDDVKASADFVLALNASAVRAAARRIGPASEACFSAAAHLELIGERVALLRTIDPEQPAGREAVSLAEKIADAWQSMRAPIMGAFDQMSVGVERELDPDTRCLSPSDIGFHNALRRPDGTLAFVDFEYAGWDDPAKLIADFHYQPGVPITAQWGASFARRVFEGLGADETLRDRASILRPLFGLKWCCIMLNAFVPGGMDRRVFSGGCDDERAFKQAQICKAEAQLRRVTEEPTPWRM